MDKDKKLYSKTPHKTACAFILLFTVMLITSSLATSWLDINGAIWRVVLILFTSTLPLIISILVYIFKYEPDTKQFFRLTPLSTKQILYFFLLGICAWAVSTVINIPMTMFVSFFGEMPETVVPEITTAAQYIISVLGLAVMPAIFEELFCRGIIMRCYENYSKATAVILSAILFSLMHNDFTSIPFTLFIGLVAAVCVIKTSSIYPAMILHFTANFISTTISALSPVFGDRYDIFAVLWLIIMVCSVMFIFLFIPMLKKNHKPAVTQSVIDIDLSDMNKSESDDTGKTEFKPEKPLKFGFSLSLVLIIFIFVIMQLSVISSIINPL